MSVLRSPWVRPLLALLVLPLSVYLVFRLSLYSLAEFAEGWHAARPGDRDSSNAEIVVLVPNNSPDGFSVQLEPISTSSDYAAAHPGATFLIPPDRKDRVQELLKSDLKLSWDTFEVKQLADGSEQITLFFMDRTDDSHGSRYTASKTGVSLESYRYISDRGGIGIVLLAMAITAVFHLLLFGYLITRAVYLSRKQGRASDNFLPQP